MMRNILVLALNDLAIALKNKTIYLVLFIPLLVFVSMKLVDLSLPLKNVFLNRV